MDDGALIDTLIAMRSQASLILDLFLLLPVLSFVQSYIYNPSKLEYVFPKSRVIITNRRRIALLSGTSLASAKNSFPQFDANFIEREIHPKLLKFKDILVCGGRLGGKGNMSDKKLSSSSSISKRAIVSSFFRNAFVSTGVLTFVSPTHVNAGVVRDYSKLESFQKLATTPLFFISNSGGNPYLQEDHQTGDPQQRIIVYFMSLDDANDYLNEMAQGNPQNVNEFRITAVSMSKTMDKIKAHKQSRKIGRHSMSTIYRIQPSTKQCANAEKIVSQSKSKLSSKVFVKRAKDGDKVGIFNSISIPVFTVKGVLLERKPNSYIKPYYFAYEDLIEDMTKLNQQDQEGDDFKTPSKGDQFVSEVEVRDLSEVLCHSECSTFWRKQKTSISSRDRKGRFENENENENDKQNLRTDSVGLVPPRKEIEVISSYYRGQGVGNIRKEFVKAKILGK